MISKDLLDILCCPETKADLVLDGDTLVSTDKETRRRYRIEDDSGIDVQESYVTIDGLHFITTTDSSYDRTINIADAARVGIIENVRSGHRRNVHRNGAGYPLTGVGSKNAAPIRLYGLVQ